MCGTRRTIFIICAIMLLPLMMSGCGNSSTGRSAGFSLLESGLSNSVYRISIFILLLLVIILAVILFLKSRRTKQKLEELVREKTRELEIQTSLLMTIFDSSPDFIFCKNLESRYTHCNKSTGVLFNVDIEDTIGKTDAEAFNLPTQITDNFLLNDKKVINERRTFAFEEKIPHYLDPEKSLIVETIKSPLIQNGEVVGILGIARDITKRKAMEEELKRQTSTLTTLIDTIPDLLYTADLNLHFVHFNRALMEHLGLSKEDIIGKDSEQTKLPEEIMKTHAEYNRKVIHEGRTLMLEEYLPHVNGTTPLYETIRRPIVVDGVIIGALGIGRNITKRKEIERELELQTATLTALFDSIPDLIFTKDLDLRFIQCNKSFLEHFGLRKENIIGKRDTEVLGLTAEKAEEFKEWDLQVIRECRVLIREELAPKRVDGTILAVETVKTPLILNGSVIGVLCIARDITKFKKMEEAALAASHSKSAFLANMSHEIRTPMNSIVGFSELALDNEASPKIKNYLINILKNSEWLLQIINDILDISKIESGRMELEKMAFDLNELFAACRTIILPKAVDKDLTLHFHAEPSIGRRLMGDPTRLRQVFLNLISNAIKFTRTGIVKVLAVIKEKTDESVTMYFEVKDSGIGMTGDQMTRIFLPFMQAETGTTRKYGGTGLGLTITKNIIELMGGKLSVESVVDVGSRFSFALTFDTIDVPEDEMASRKAIFKDLEKPVLEGEVLVCEDNVMNQQVICEHLARVGLETVVAENGKVAVEMVQSRMGQAGKQFNMIFMDIHMPVMDGLEAAAKIFELDLDIPIIAMTANIMSDDMEIYKKSGMTECVGKPFTSQELWRCLLKYLTPVCWEIVKDNRYTQIDNELRQNLLGNFIKDNQNTYNDITGALNTGDIKLAHRLAHTLKSNAAHLNSTRLQMAAANIEQRLKDGKNLVTRNQMLLFKTELESALSQFAVELEANSGPQRELPPPGQMAKPLDTISAQILISKLDGMLKIGNPECRKIAGELRRIPAGLLKDSNTLAVEEVIQHIDDFDFEQASAILLSILKAE